MSNDITDLILEKICLINKPVVELEKDSSGKIIGRVHSFKKDIPKEIRKTGRYKIKSFETNDNVDDNGKKVLKKKVVIKLTPEQAREERKRRRRANTGGKVKSPYYVKKLKDAGEDPNKTKRNIQKGKSRKSAEVGGRERYSAIHNENINNIDISVSFKEFLNKRGIQ